MQMHELRQLRLSARRLPFATAALRPENIISLTSLTRSFAHAPLHRAVGIDGLSGDLLHTAPTALARLAHPLMTKVALTGKEPLGFEG